MASTATIPQVVLFGSMQGEWREKYVIPVLDELGVSYFNPIIPGQDWTPEMGQKEAAMMAACETIVMVINAKTAAFTSLAETGWAALGASQRGQTLILGVLAEDYAESLPFYLKIFPKVREMNGYLNHYAKAMRNLVRGHAEKFDRPGLVVTDTMEGVVAALKKRYAKT